MKKLLVATWGNPRAWAEVEYCVGDKKICCKSSTKAVAEAEEPDETFIVVLDTLGSGSSYALVRSKALRVAQEFAREWGVEAEALVGPGKGAFREGRFEGDALDYYYWAFYQLAEILVARARRVEEVILDLSHGINFMPVLTYRAVRELLELLNIMRHPENRVRLKVYNSDPYAQGAGRLWVNLIEESAPPPEVSVSPVKTSDLRPLYPLSTKPEERAEFFIKFKLPVRPLELHAFLSALKNGFPLLLACSYPDPQGLLSVIKKCLRTYFEEVKVDIGPPAVVKRRLRLTDGFKLLTASWFVAEALRLLAYIGSPKREHSFSRIRELALRLYDHDPKVQALVKADLVKIKDAAQEVGGDWMLLSEALAKRQGLPHREPSLERRNFAAHSGLERSCVEIKREGEEIFLRYREEMWLRVLKVAGGML